MKSSLEPALLMIAAGIIILIITCSLDPASAWVGLAAIGGGIAILIWGAIEDWNEKRKAKIAEMLADIAKMLEEKTT